MLTKFTGLNLQSHVINKRNGLVKSQVKGPYNYFRCTKEKTLNSV